MSQKQELIDKLTSICEDKCSHLNDYDYCEVLEGVSCNLDASVQAKREELSRDTGLRSKV